MKPYLLGLWAGGMTHKGFCSNQAPSQDVDVFMTGDTISLSYRSEYLHLKACIDYFSSSQSFKCVAA